MNSGDIRLLSADDATMVSKLLLDISEKNFQQRITSRTGQLYRALQQSTTQTAFAANSATLTLTPADLPGMSRPGSRSSVQRPNTSYYGAIVFASGPRVFGHTPVIFGHAPVVFRFGPNGTRSPFDFDAGQQQQIMDTIGPLMAENVVAAYKDFYHK